MCLSIRSIKRRHHHIRYSNHHIEITLHGGGRENLRVGIIHFTSSCLRTVRTLDFFFRAYDRYMVFFHTTISQSRKNAIINITYWTEYCVKSSGIHNFTWSPNHAADTSERPPPPNPIDFDSMHSEMRSKSESSGTFWLHQESDVFYGQGQSKSVKKGSVYPTLLKFQNLIYDHEIRRKIWRHYLHRRWVWELTSARTGQSRYSISFPRLPESWRSRCRRTER